MSHRTTSTGLDPRTLPCGFPGAMAPLEGPPQVGDVVAIHSRGAWRLAKVVKVGVTNVKAAYTTPGGWVAAAECAQAAAAWSDEYIERWAAHAYDSADRRRKLQEDRAAAQRGEDHRFVNVTNKTVNIDDLRLPA